MASAFGHAALAISLGSAYNKRFRTLKFFLIGAACSILPDADVVGFAVGIPYEAFWGHRGFTHSFVFALLFGFFVTFLFYRKQFKGWSSIALGGYFSLATASHAVLDAMTSGGLGVAFFAPADNGRYFLPWRPIQVSPIGVESFFSEWGLRVLSSELIWIGLPSVLFIVAVTLFRRVSKP